MQGTVRDPENNIDLGGLGGGGREREANVVVSLFTSECAWKGNFVTDFVSKPESFHSPRAVFSRTCSCSIRNVCDDITVLFHRLLQGQNRSRQW